jgi:hypothetical protein
MSSSHVSESPWAIYHKSYREKSAGEESLKTKVKKKFYNFCGIHIRAFFQFQYIKNSTLAMIHFLRTHISGFLSADIELPDE